MPDQFEWMTLLQIPFILGAVWALSRPLSLYMATVAMRQTTPLDRFLTPLEERIYQWTGIKPEQEQRWQYYALDAVYLNAMGVVFLIFLQMTQHIVFSKAGVDFIQALNTAISFATNTNWQSYIPETTLDNRVQTIGLTRLRRDYAPWLTKSLEKAGSEVGGRLLCLVSIFLFTS